VTRSLFSSIQLQAICELGENHYAYAFTSRIPHAPVADVSKQARQNQVITSKSPIVHAAVEPMRLVYAAPNQQRAVNAEPDIPRHAH